MRVISDCCNFILSENVPWSTEIKVSEDEEAFIRKAFEDYEKASAIIYTAYQAEMAARAQAAKDVLDKVWAQGCLNSEGVGANEDGSYTEAQKELARSILK